MINQYKYNFFSLFSAPEYKGLFKSDNDVTLFVHIPKTAGMSLGAGLFKCFDKVHSIPWNDIQKASHNTVKKVADSLAYGEKMRRIVPGHFHFRHVKLYVDNHIPFKAISFMRDPVKRIISNYNYNCSEVHPPHAEFKAKFPTLRDFVINLQRDEQLKQLVGIYASYDQAFERLQNYYQFIGLTEFYDKSTKLLSASFGLAEIKTHRVNEAKKTSEKQHINQDDIDLIKEKTQLEQKLFDHLYKEYEKLEI